VEAFGSASDCRIGDRAINSLIYNLDRSDIPESIWPGIIVGYGSSKGHRSDRSIMIYADQLIDYGYPDEIISAAVEAFGSASDSRIGDREINSLIYTLEQSDIAQYMWPDILIGYGSGKGLVSDIHLMSFADVIKGNDFGTAGK
jgi:hypothetical protein